VERRDNNGSEAVLAEPLFRRCPASAVSSVAFLADVAFVVEDVDARAMCILWLEVQDGAISHAGENICTGGRNYSRKGELAHLQPLFPGLGEPLHRGAFYGHCGSSKRQLQIGEIGTPDVGSGSSSAGRAIATTGSSAT